MGHRLDLAIQAAAIVQKCLRAAYKLCCTILKKWLDKFWADQNVIFDWTADITGTGDRSE